MATYTTPRTPGTPRQAPGHGAPPRRGTPPGSAVPPGRVDPRRGAQPSARRIFWASANKTAGSPGRRSPNRMGISRPATCAAVSTTSRTE